MKKFRISRRLDRAGTMTALTVVVLALFYLFNTVLLTLADQYSWYFYTTAQYDLTPSGNGDALLSQIDTEDGGVKIVFCDTQTNIEKHKQLDFVHKTAIGLAERHPELITVEYVNLWLEPAKLEPYRYDDEGNERIIDANSVIVDYRGEHIIASPESFYILDENKYVTSYNGEEVFVSSILRVSTAEHPVAYFTSNHGEEVPEALYRLLFYSGYTVQRLDLSTVAAVPEDAGMVIISAPIYDFQKSAVGSSYVSELKKLENYLAKDGKLFVTLDPRHTEGLPRLCEFLATYGLTPEAGTLVDTSNSLPGSSGYTLLLDYATEGLGQKLGELASAGGRRTVLSRALPLSFTDSTLATAEPILYSAATAILYADDGSEIGSGARPVMAMSRLHEGEGRVLLAGSAYFAATDAVNSESYGNKTLLYALIDECGDMPVPIGISSVAVDRTAVENLTMGEANRFTMLSAVVFPCALLIGGLIFCYKRKNH